MVCIRARPRMWRELWTARQPIYSIQKVYGVTVVENRSWYRDTEKMAILVPYFLLKLFSRVVTPVGIESRVCVLEYLFYSNNDWYTTLQRIVNFLLLLIQGGKQTLMILTTLWAHANCLKLLFQNWRHNCVKNDVLSFNHKRMCDRQVLNPLHFINAHIIYIYYGNSVLSVLLIVFLSLACG